MSLARSFARTGFARFINSPSGRAARIVAGLGLLVWGYTQLPGAVGIVLMVVSFLPLVAGSLDLCLTSPLLGGPVSGAAVRKMSKEPE